MSKRDCLKIWNPQIIQNPGLRIISHSFPHIFLLRAAGIFAHTPSQGPGVLAAVRAGVLVEVLEEMIDGRHGGMSPAEGWDDPS